MPLAKIENEFEQMKHALFTEPNYQSSWNYHRWLVSLLMPVQVESVKMVEGKGIEIRFSSVLTSSSSVEVIANGERVGELRSGKEASKVFSFVPTQQINTLQIKAASGFKDINGQPLFREAILEW